MSLLRTHRHPQGRTGTGLGLEIISGLWVMVWLPSQPSGQVPISQMVLVLPAIQVLPVGPRTSEQEIQLQISTAPLVSGWRPAHTQASERGRAA